MAVAAALVTSERSAESEPNTPEKKAETMSRLVGCASSDPSVDVNTIEMSVRP